MAKEKESNNIIMKDVHCPFCGSDKALLLSKTTSKKISIQFPAYGLKFILSLAFLSLIHVWINGYKLIEAVKEIENVTYGFCPECGNSYSMAPPEAIKEEVKDPKFYRVKKGMKIKGFCTGVSKYTGIPLLWIRIMGIIYAVASAGLAVGFYFLVSSCIPFEEDNNG